MVGTSVEEGAPAMLHGAAAPVRRTRERGNRGRERGQRGREGKEKAGREAGARRVLLQVVAGYEGVGPVRNSRRIFGFGEDPEVGDAGGGGMGQGS